MTTADPRPRILHVIHSLAMGGMENGLVNIINNTADAFQHHVACIERATDFRERITAADVEITSFERNQIGVWRLRRALYHHIKSVRPAVLHTRNITALDAILPGRLAGVGHIIHSEHGWDLNDVDGVALRPKILRRAHRPFITEYIGVSQHLTDYLQQQIGVPPQRIHTICNGVDTTRFRPRSVTLPAPPGFLCNDSIVVTTVGRLTPVKDQASLVRAFRLVVDALSAEDGARLRLMICGDGPSAAALAALVAELGLQQQVWLPGPIDNVHDFLARTDVFVLPSLLEGISNTILEALASGCPVVSTRAGGTPELVEPGVVGALFTPGDVADLRDILLGYVNHPERRRQHAANARQVAESRFALPLMIDRYRDIYLAASGSAHAPAAASPTP